MKQSILKKPSHFFCDGADSSISSINGANFASVARSTDTEGSQVKNVRFLDLIQQAPTTLDSPRTETSLNYINFQRFSSSSTNSFSSPHSGLNRRPKTSIGLKTFNVFSGHENQGKLDDDDPLTAYSAQRASALSFTLKNPTQTPQTSSQLQQSQHDLLRRALRISSASIENRGFHHSVRPIDSTPIPLPRQQPQAHDESKQHSTVEQDDTNNQHSSTQQHHHQPESLTSSSNFQSPSLLSLSSNFHPINYRVKKLETSQHPQNAQTSDQQQQTAVTMNHRPVVKPRISSASSSSTYSTTNNTNLHSTTTAATPIATTVYFPSSNQYLNIQSAPLSNTTATTTNRVGSASRVTSANNNSNGGGRAVMTTNLALYTYLLQANKTLAKEMRASVIRSQSKNSADLSDNSTVSYIAGTNDDNSPMISSGNRAIYSIPFPGVKEKMPNNNNNNSNNGTRNNQYRSSTSLRKRTPVPTSKVNYRISNSATLRRNANLINSKYSSN